MTSPNPSGVTVVPPGYVDTHNWTATQTPTVAGLAPSGDTSGVKDAANIQALLNLAGLAVLQPGAWVVNATIQVPGHGALQGYDPDSTVITQAAGANLNAVIASAGWTASSNATSVTPCRIRGLQVDVNSSAQTGGAGHGIVLQSFWSLVEDCIVINAGSDGFRLDTSGASGSPLVSNTMVETKFVRCQARQSGLVGIHVADTSSNKATDGFIDSCIVQASGSHGIQIASGAGWHVTGNHVYTSALDGIRVERAFESKVIGNYVEPWGSSTISSRYCGINLPNCNDTGNGSVVAGNVIHFTTAAGNAGSTIQGIFIGASTSAQGNVSVTGNMLFASQTAAQAIFIFNQAASSTLDAAISGNKVSGAGWSAPFGMSSAAGTMKVRGDINRGTATLAAGTVTVSNVAVQTTSLILLAAQDNNTAGALRVSARTAGTSFVITSSNAADTGSVAWEVTEP